ncbi:uncharacterized protein LOC144581983 isoform X2 [Callithrix jacchus]
MTSMRLEGLDVANVFLQTFWGKLRAAFSCYIRRSIDAAESSQRVAASPKRLQPPVTRFRLPIRVCPGAAAVHPSSSATPLTFRPLVEAVVRCRQDQL